MLRIRIIPATIATAAVLLGVKIFDVARGTQDLSNEMFIPKVEAASSGDAAAAKSEAAAPAADAKKTDAAASGDKKPAEEGKKDESKSGDASKAAPPPPPGDKGTVSDTAPDETVDHRYTAVEVELLENLARRRQELDHWEQNIQIKEQALSATEKRIDDKIAQIDAMKKEVSALLAQYNEKEDAKIHSLVKIYENMKPTDAARIFNELEMPILLQVIDKMSEKKAAPILADMDPQKAKQVTVQLAEQHRIDSAKISMAGMPPAAGAPAAPPASPAPAAPPPAAPVQ